MEKRVKILESTLYILVFTLFAFALFFDLFVTATVPRFTKIFQEMLGGEPLPALTEMIMSFSVHGLGIDFLFVLILIALFMTSKLKYFLPAGVAFIIIICVKIVFIYTGLMLPILVVIKKLGGG